MSGLCTCFLPSRHGALLAVTCAVAAALGGTTGCQSVPRLRNPSGVAWNAAPVPATSSDLQKSLLTAVPDFDPAAESGTVVRDTDASAAEKPASENVVAEKVAVAAATAAGLTNGQVNSASTADRSPTEANAPAGSNPALPTGTVLPGTATAGANSVPPTITPAVSTPAVSITSSSGEKLPAAVTEPTVASTLSTLAPGAKSASPAPANAQPKSSSTLSPPTASAPSPVTTTSPAITQLAKADGLSKTDSGTASSVTQEPVVNKRQSTETAAAKPATPQNLPAYSERRPEAFAWRRTGRTAGGRQFEISLTGENGFRTLFVGSAVGNDRISMQLMDRLARHLHENGLILGGFEVAVIHTLNPDGAASGQPTNALGRYVNGRFPPQPDQKPAASTPEVDFLLGCIRSFRPQRVVHVRTIEDSAGVIACNERCTETVEQIAEALRFSRLSIPAQTREGSLERCLAAQADLDVITLALPRGEKAEGDPWALYGDTLLNLLRPQAAGGREANRAVSQGGAKSP